jgi:hypothetical protein
MREAGLQGARRRRTKFTTRHDAKAARPPDLVDRDFRAEAPDRLWIADLTYVRTWAGFCYVAFVEDVFSRMIVGWSIATHLRASLATEALEMVWRRGASVEGLIHLHLGRLLRAPRRTRDRSVGQQHRRFVRQRHGGVGDRALQDRADPPAGPWRNPTRWSSPRSSTSTGSTINDCTVKSATCRPRSSRRCSTLRGSRSKSKPESLYRTQGGSGLISGDLAFVDIESLPELCCNNRQLRDSRASVTED